MLLSVSLGNLICVLILGENQGSKHNREYGKSGPFRWTIQGIVYGKFLGAVRKNLWRKRLAQWALVSRMGRVIEDFLSTKRFLKQKRLISQKTRGV